MGNALDLNPQDPNDGSRINIAFGSCKTPVGGNIPMGTLSVINFSGGPNRLFVKRHSTASNPDYQCGLFTICDDPVYSKVCMTQAVPDTCVLGTQKPLIETADPIAFTAGLNQEGGDGGSAQDATFELIATLAGILPDENPWSPVDQRLAFFGEDGGVYVFNASTPQEPAVLVLPSSTEYYFRRNQIAWSPDGEWILCRTQTPDDHRAGLSSLVARSADGTSGITTLVRGEIRPFTWAANGTIYWWDSTNRRRSLSPPTEWQPETLPLPDQPVLYSLNPGGEGLSEFRTQPQVQEQQITPPNAYATFVRGIFPDLHTYLVVIADESRGTFGAVIDQNGTILVDLGDEKDFIASSLSSDGQHIVGFKEVSQDGKITGTPMWVAAADGTWRVPVQPTVHGIFPQFAHFGDMIAFRELVSGAIHVGHLQVSP